MHTLAIFVKHGILGDGYMALVNSQLRLLHF